MTAPVNYLKLEVAFASGPDDAAPTWTDITAYWLLSSGASINRGRGDETGDISPGTLSLTLDNSDGRFTPGLASSPYYPNVKIRKQIRITYREGGVGTTYAIFHGHVDEWPVEWPGGNKYTEAQISASDRTKRLGAMMPLRGVPQEAILSDSPTAYFPLTEPEGSTAAGDISTAGLSSALTSVQYGSGGTIKFGQGTGPATDSTACIMFERVDASNGKGLSATSSRYNPVGDDTHFRFEFTFNTTASSQRFIAFASNLGEEIRVGIDNLGKLELGTAVDGSLPGSVNSSSTYTDGQTHHVYVSFVSGGNATLDVDGVNVISFSTSASWATALPVFTSLRIGTSANVVNATMSHLAVGISTNHYDGVINGYSGESTDDRISRIAGWVGMSSFLALDSGATTSLAHIDTTGRTALSVMEDIADTEGGVIFASRDGNITFHARTRRFTATSAATLNTSNSDIGEVLRFRTNDQFLVNDVVVTSPGGQAHATSASSIASAGYARKDITVYTNSQTEATDVANWIINTTATESARTEQLAVDLLTCSSATRTAIIQTDISSRIGLAGLPSTASSSTADLFIEGYSESISSTEWTRTLNTSSATAASVWLLGTAGSTELGTTTRLAY